MAEETEQMTLEQLHGITTDPEAETRVAQALGIPAGTYNSVPEVSMTLRVSPADAQHPGRKAAHFYGFFNHLLYNFIAVGNVHRFFNGKFPDAA